MYDLLKTPKEFHTPSNAQSYPRSFRPGNNGGGRTGICDHQPPANAGNFSSTFRVPETHNFPQGVPRNQPYSHGQHPQDGPPGQPCQGGPPAGQVPQGPSSGQYRHDSAHGQIPQGPPSCQYYQGPSHGQFPQGSSYVQPPQGGQRDQTQPYSHYPMNSHSGSQPFFIPNYNSHGLEPKIPTFSGIQHDFPEWRAIIRTIIDHYPDNIRVPILKEHLDKDSQALVAYISVIDPDAYRLIWVELDRKNLHGLSPSHYHTGQLLKLIRRKRCSSLTDLEDVHNQLKFHWSKLCRMGPQYAAYAESVLVGISDILYGQSQTEVDRLAYENRNFNVSSVLNAIWNHIGQARARLSNHKIAEEMAPKPDPNGSRRSYSPTGGGHYSRGYKVSFSEQRDKRNDSPYPSTSPTSSSPQRGASPITSRDGSPAYRGQRTRSPSPRYNRAPKAFKCNFCKVNDHKSIQCAKFTPEQYLHMANEQQLCYICMMPGHTGWVCPLPTSCQTSACQNLTKHSAMLCKALVNLTSK